MEEAEPNRLSLFYELWTLKESYLKALGSGLTASMRSFTIRRDGQGFYAESEGQRLPFFFRQYALDNRYKLAVCSREPVFSEYVQVLTLEGLLALARDVE